MSLELRYRGETTVPVEVEGVLPSATRELSVDAVRRLPIFHGKEQVTLGEFFDVDGDPADEVIHWHGDLQGVHWIGAKMDGGVMHLHGNGGRHVGSEMKKGEIHVAGDVGDWLGGELRGGLLHVRGNAGHLVGAAYRGSARGMRGGEILVHGKTGNEVGHTLRRGLIAVGETGDLAGFNMLAGTLFVAGDSGIRHGAGMRRGTLMFASNPPKMLLSFREAGPYTPPFVPLLLRRLRDLDFPVAAEWSSSQWRMHHGDMIEGGRGEVLIRDAE